MALTGDVSRGLSILRRTHQDRADEISALEAIEAAGGLDRLTAETQARADAAKLDLEEAVKALAATGAAREVAVTALADIQAHTAALRQKAEIDAATTRRRADVTADEITKAAHNEANNAIAVGAASAKRIIDTAQAVADDIAAQTLVARTTLTELNNEIADLRSKVETIANERRRLLKTLT